MLWKKKKSFIDNRRRSWTDAKLFMLSVPKLKLLTLLLVINISAKLYQSFDSHDIQKYGGSERSNTLQLKKLPSNRKTMKKHIKAMEILKNTHTSCKSAQTSQNTQKCEGDKPMASKQSTHFAMAGVSNIRLGAQNWPSKDSSSARWTTFKNMKKFVDLELFILQLFLLIRPSPLPFTIHQSNYLTDKQWQ